MADDFKAKLSERNIPLVVISMQDYGLMNGERVLKQALDLLN